MSSARWTQIENLYHQAAGLPTVDRTAFLKAACGGDDWLFREVLSLLAIPPDDRALESALEAALEQLIEEPEQDAHLVGQRIGCYTILEFTGQGGMGTVYRAMRDDEFRMEVAIKLLKRGADTRLALSRFQTERRILAQLQHPNIARLLDGGATAAGLPYFVMEFVHGAPLLDYARPFSIRRRLELFRLLCAAVQYAHQNLVIHRDIKPSNVLVTADGIPKLLDFGIARILHPDGQTTLTAAGERLMTPDYASPEQLRGEPLTTATDIYSLGAVLHELITGKRARQVEIRPPGAIQAPAFREPKSLRSVAPDIDADLDNIILTALRTEPERRYPSVEHFSEDIRLYLEGRPVRARKDTLRYRAGKFLRRNRTGVAVAVLALLGLATGAVAIDRQARRAEHRFQQVRKLANIVLFDLNQEIETLAGSTRAREILVRTSLEYLDSLVAEAGDDTSLRLELASAYEKIGDVVGNPVFSNLGRPQGSLDSYAKALAIAQRMPPSAPVLELSARSRYKTGCVYNWALRRISEARRYLREAVRTAESIPPATGQPAWRVRAEANGFLGDMETYLDPAAALPPLRRSLQIAGDWVRARPGPESRYFLAIATSRLGIALQETGDLHSSLAHLLQALRLIEQLLDQDPDNAVWTRERHAIYDRLGWVTGHPQYINLGDRKAAAAWVNKLLAPSGSPGAEHLLAADPANVRARFELSEALAAAAAVSREDDPSGAARKYRRALRLSASVLASNPNDAHAAFWQAFNRVGFAWVLERLGNPREALAQLDAAVALLEKLTALDPDDVRLHDFLGLALQTRGSHRVRTADPGGAIQDLERSRSLLEPLYRANSPKLSRVRDLAGCYRAYGDLYASRADWKSARDWYRKSLQLWDRWKEVGNSSVYDREHRDAVARNLAKLPLR